MVNSHCHHLSFPTKSGQIFYHSHYRCLLAAMHFNYNLNRQAKTNANGEATLRVNYPKQKYGEATVKEGKSQQNYGNVHVHI